MCIFTAAAATAAGATSLGTALTIGGHIATLASTVSQYMQQKKQGEAQAKAAQEQLNQTVAQNSLQYNSELNKSQQSKFKVTRAALVAASTASAAAAESGVTGLSVDNIKGEVSLKRDESIAEHNYNADVLYADTNNRLKMAKRGAAANVASITPPNLPDFGSLMGGIAKLSIPQKRGTPGVDLYPKGFT